MEGVMAEVRMFGGNFAPRSWAFCDGQLLAISQYSALFSLLGTTYGGDGRTTFALPDLRGRTPRGAQSSTGPGLSYVPLGQRSGTETNTLSILNLPSHNHAGTGNFNVVPVVYSSDNNGNDPKSPGNAFGKNVFDDDGSSSKGDFIYKTSPVFSGDTLNANSIVAGGSVTVSNTGSQQPTNNMVPWLAVNYIICLQGIFPSRS